MTLASYLASSGLTLSEFARQIGAHNARTVQRYTKHGRVPSGRMIAKIETATGGAVRAHDFLSAAAAE